MKKQFLVLLAIIAIAAPSSQSFALSKKTKANKNPQVVVHGVVYKTDIKGIDIVLQKGHDTDIQFNILPSAALDYIFVIRSNTIPDLSPYAIVPTPASGGSSQNQNIVLHFRSKYLPADGLSPREYKISLPIEILWANDFGDTNRIQLPIRVIALP